MSPWWGEYRASRIDRRCSDGVAPRKVSTSFFRLGQVAVSATLPVGSAGTTIPRTEGFEDRLAQAADFKSLGSSQPAE